MNLHSEVSICMLRCVCRRMTISRRSGAICTHFPRLPLSAQNTPQSTSWRTRSLRCEFAWDAHTVPLLVPMMDNLLFIQGSI